MTKANLKRLEEGKLYYSISEVCSMTGLEQHVLRYWESEFPQLRPKKNRSGNRAYRAKEIKIIRYIKYLLYEEMYTIPGAKKKMADANMSDLDGQLTLLRVPAAVPTPEPQSAPPIPAPSASATEDLSPSDQDQDDTDENGDTRSEADPDSHSGDGGLAAAKLREELRRVKQELQSLLAALAPQGR
jgi:DNA-binding transcriptional MerR regulator